MTLDTYYDDKICFVCWERIDPYELPCPACGMAAHANCSDDEIACVPDEDRVPWSKEEERDCSLVVCLNCVGGDA
jgi:predicted amidophosphoribosyltransferase